VALQPLVPRTVFASLSEKYTAQTGLPLILVNAKGEIVSGLNRSCKICGRLLKSRASAFDAPCRLRRIQAIEEAFRYGEGYITTCPLGLIIFAVPLVRDNALLGGFLSGFAVFPEMKKDIRDEMAGHLRAFGEAVSRSRFDRLKFKVILMEEVRDDVAFLWTMTKKSGLNDLGVLRARNESYIQQYKIANVLEDLKKSNSDAERSFLNKHEAIIEKVKFGDKTGAREILNEILGSIFFMSGMNFEIIKVRVIELIVILSRAAIEAGAEAKELLGLNYSFLTDLNSVTETEALLPRLNEILENFIQKVYLIKAKKTQGAVGRMKEYLRHHYKGKLRAGEVAKAAGLSKSRASHLFREETGSSLLEYQRKLRIDRGKHLLMNSDLSLADLAVELGFFDQSHFTRTFKQTERMPPSHFRRKFRDVRPQDGAGRPG